MSIIVQKYGGVCLESPEKIKAVAGQLAQLYKQGHRVVAVVSAMGKSTDGLIKLAYQVSDNPNRRELDMLLTTGERVSMSLLGMALTDLGCAAISFTGSQAGVLTDSSHSNARIVEVKPIRLLEELNKNKIVVLAGFQGVHPQSKEITTLGRGGSDTTAVAMAAALGAERCEIIKEVDGICSADPRLVTDCKSYSELSYAALLDMTFWGAKVLHYRSVELAQSSGVHLVIRKWGTQKDSTVIKQEVQNMEVGKVLSINSLARVEHVQVNSGLLADAMEIFGQYLSTQKLPWPQILASATDKSSTRIAFTADNEALDTLLRGLSGNKQIQVIKSTLSSVTTTCHGSVGTDLAQKITEVLKTNQISIDKMILSPLSVTAFIEPAQREKAVQALHSLIKA